MNDYKQLRIDITPCSETGTDIMAYLLAEAGFESFIPDDKGLTAFVKVEDYDPVKINDAISQYPFAASLELSSETIEGRDWNAEWERNYFQPITIGNRCVVHSSFHTDIPQSEYDIVIDPKMAFGTGHHSTTSLILGSLLDMDLDGKVVIDMGTGTGILAILAAKKKAQKVFAVEIDSFAYNNAIENIALNNVEDKVEVINGDATSLAQCNECDIFIANINRNVITEDLNFYVEKLRTDGIMLLSGFYEQDIPVIMETASKFGLQEISHECLNDWTCLKLRLTK